jgi:hypothetical protein
MSVAELTFEALGLNFDLYLTYPGPDPAYLPLAYSVTGTVGGELITGRTGYFGNSDIGVTNDYPYVTASGISIAVGTVYYNIFDGYDPAKGNVADVITSQSTTEISEAEDLELIFLACFVSGTLIATPSGEVPVETLSIGDSVLLAPSPNRSALSAPVRWIGYRRLDLARCPAHGDAAPVRIVAGALAAGVPRRDLLVSPDHAMLIDGLLVPARLLVNGATVVRELGMRHVTYFHVELDAHDLLLAEGAPTESYLDTGNRGMFENTGLPMRLHPHLEGDRQSRETSSCMPFATAPAVVEPVWRALAARAEGLGWTPPEAPMLSDDPELCLVADGRRIEPLEVEDGRYVFAVPACDRLSLVSRAARPADLCAWLDDRRRLGVQVRRLTVRHGRTSMDIPMDHPMLAEGWWAAEHDGHAPCRWTNGNAVLMPVRFGVVEVQLGGRTHYPKASPGADRRRDTPARAAIGL